jgi:hypothetical protein
MSGYQGASGQPKGVLVTSDVITLPDDRRLSWHEFGDPDGAPVLYTEVAVTLRRDSCADLHTR